MSDDIQLQSDIFNGLNLHSSESNQNNERSFSIEPTVLQIGRNYSLSLNRDEFDVLFYEMAGNSQHISELNFTNYDNGFPSSTTLKNGFDFISRDIKLALLNDTKWIRNYESYKNRLLPILKTHIPEYRPAELYDGDYTELVESRIHEGIEKGSFRVFSKYVSKGSVWNNGEKVGKSTLIVLFYDPYHLVFIDKHQEKIGVNPNTYNLVKDYEKTIKSRYYTVIPDNLRITM